jgi:hypothetical protein
MDMELLAFFLPVYIDMQKKVRQKEKIVKAMVLQTPQQV